MARILFEVVSHLDALPENEQAEWVRGMSFLYQMVWHKREAEEQQSLFDIMDEAVERHVEKAREVKMTGAQVLIAQGRKEGRQEGRQEGRREVLLRLLRLKFGALPETAIAKVNALMEEQMDSIIEQVLTAETLAELGL